jgi:hypothetical protein
MRMPPFHRHQRFSSRIDVSRNAAHVCGNDNGAAENRGSKAAPLKL